MMKVFTMIADASATGGGFEVPISWVLGIIGILGATIATLAGIIYRSLEKRIESQNVIIGAQSLSIKNLQVDIGRLSRGCGMDACIWSHHARQPLQTPQGFNMSDKEAVEIVPQ